MEAPSENVLGVSRIVEDWRIDQRGAGMGTGPHFCCCLGGFPVPVLPTPSALSAWVQPQMFYCGISPSEVFNVQFALIIMLGGEGIGPGNSLIGTKLAAKLIESFFLCGGGCQTYGIERQNETPGKHTVETQQ